MKRGNKEQIQSRIHYYMVQRNMTISELSKLLKVTHQRASRIVKGKAINENYSMPMIETLAEIFEVTLFEMLTPLPESVKNSSLTIPDGRKKKSNLTS